MPTNPRGNAGVVVAIMLAVVALLVAIASVFFYLNLWGQHTSSRSYPVAPKPYPKQEAALVQLTTPAANSTVTSPVEIAGSAPGNWFFEGSFPITVLAADGTELAHTQAQAVGDWMTTDQVDFTASVVYASVESQSVELVFQPDNPSGKPDTTKYSIPLTLAATE